MVDCHVHFFIDGEDGRKTKCTTIICQTEKSTNKTTICPYFFITNYSLTTALMYTGTPVLFLLHLFITQQKIKMKIDSASISAALATAVMVINPFGIPSDCTVFASVICMKKKMKAKLNAV